MCSSIQGTNVSTRVQTLGQKGRPQPLLQETKPMTTYLVPETMLSTGRTTGDPESPWQVDLLPDSSPPTMNSFFGMYSWEPGMTLSFMNLKCQLSSCYFRLPHCLSSFKLSVKISSKWKEFWVSRIFYEAYQHMANSLEMMCISSSRKCLGCSSNWHCSFMHPQPVTATSMPS